MNIREPLVHATYFYLREAPGDSPARRLERHESFVADARHRLQSLAGWLAMPEPTLPPIPAWETEGPAQLQPLMQTGQLAGRTNASALVAAYALRNMLLLRVIIARAGEHDQTVWSMLDAALGESPATPSWLHTARYWCAVAPRPPEDLEHERLQPVKTPFGVLCLGQDEQPHLLVYPDARTESRANVFLGSLAAQIDWYAVQARYRLDAYMDRASNATRQQQQALDRVAQVAHWGDGTEQRLLLGLLHTELDMLELTYRDMLADLSATRAAAQDVRALIAGYRAALMRHGLWDAAPTVWEAQTASLAAMHSRIDADVQYVDAALRQVELVMRIMQTRISLSHGAREQVLVYLVGVIGFAALAVLVADTNLARLAVRLVALVVAAGIAWGGWRMGRSRLP